MSNCERLIKEVTGWYQNLHKQGQGAPNVFSGVCPDRQQFLCLLTPLGLDRRDRLDFMRVVLKRENCHTFAHSLWVMRDDGIECIDIYAGESGEYWGYELAIEEGGLRLINELKTDTPAIFFQELLPQHQTESINDEQRLLSVWEEAKPRIFWKKW